MHGFGKAEMERRGRYTNGVSSRGKADKARMGMVRLGGVWTGRIGKVGCDSVRRGRNGQSGFDSMRRGMAEMERKAGGR